MQRALAALLPLNYSAHYVAIVTWNPNVKLSLMCFNAWWLSNASWRNFSFAPWQHMVWWLWGAKPHCLLYCIVHSRSSYFLPWSFKRFSQVLSICSRITNKSMKFRAKCHWTVAMCVQCHAEVSCVFSAKWLDCNFLFSPRRLRFLHTVMFKWSQHKHSRWISATKTWIALVYSCFCLTTIFVRIHNKISVR